MRGLRRHNRLASLGAIRQTKTFYSRKKTQKAQKKQVDGIGPQASNIDLKIFACFAFFCGYSSSLILMAALGPVYRVTRRRLSASHLSFTRCKIREK